jgi:hypothetical protein
MIENRRHLILQLSVKDTQFILNFTNVLRNDDYVGTEVSETFG